MEKIFVVQEKNHGILTLTKLFDKYDSKSDVQTNDCDVKTDDNVDVDDDSYWCKEIINSFPIFSGAVTRLFNTKHGKNARDIDSALDNMMVGKSGNDRMNDDEKQKLKSLYVLFDKQYWELVNKYIIDSDIKDDKEDTNKIFKILLSKIADLMKNDNVTRSDRVIQLMAHIFGVWTILDCTHFLAMKRQYDKCKVKMDGNNSGSENGYENESTLYDTNECKSYLRQPKAAQVLAVMRLVGINKRMESNLIEIKTGEGKSLVLAVSACIFALLGLNSYCVSYAQLLTWRDYNQFQDLFIQLQVVEKIRYMTFTDLCLSLAREMADSDVILQMLSKTSNYTYNQNKGNRIDSANWSESQSVLLIDEVDVLFDQRYFGRLHKSFIPLKHDRECISKLLDVIWNLHKKFKRNTGQVMEMIKNTDAYSDCVCTFGFWMPLVDKAIITMIQDVQTFTHHAYIVRNDQIGYLFEDGIQYLQCGYKTTFAYYKEHQRGKISQKAIKRHKHILLRNARLSYAELPYRFGYIAGVTGTLSQLEISRKELLANKYKINKYTYIPTMFKKNQLIFNQYRDVNIVKSDSWRDQIIKEARTRMGSTNTKRPVLIFFEANGELQAFCDAYGCGMKDGCQCLILNEKLTINEKRKVIKDSCQLNTVTLCTKIFGRGIDFIVTDDRVNDLGGPHVIQTFFSDDISEEIQIKGRTARNGGNGSFSMVLNRKKVGMSDTYDKLNNKRLQMQKRANNEAFEQVKQCKIYHDKTIRLVQCVSEGNKDQVLKILMEFMNL